MYDIICNIGVLCYRQQCLTYLLYQAFSVHLQAKNELHHIKSALIRSTSDAYHVTDPAGHGRELKALDEKRAQKQQEFSNQFLTMLVKHQKTKHTDFLQVVLTSCSKFLLDTMSQAECPMKQYCTPCLARMP